MSIEEDYKECRILLTALLITTQKPQCRHVHHSRKNQHGEDEPCPVEARWEKSVADAEAFLFRDDH